MSRWCIVAAAALWVCGCLTEADWEEHNGGVPPAPDGATADACKGVTCVKGHCSGGTCKCDPGFAGARCDHCASGYSGYPGCKKNPSCKCAKGQKTCENASTIKTCDDGCNWTQKNCAWQCQPKRSLGCSSNSCWCASSGKGLAVFRIRVKSGCVKGKAKLVVADKTAKTISKPLVLPVGVQIPVMSECKPGNTLCWGVWDTSDGSYWGCGKDCAKTCKDCCVVCPKDLGFTTKELTCS